MPRTYAIIVMSTTSLSIFRSSEVSPFPAPWKRLADIIPGETNG